MTVPNKEKEPNIKSNENSIENMVKGLEDKLVQLTNVLDAQSEQLKLILNSVIERKRRKIKSAKRTNNVQTQNFIAES